MWAGNQVSNARNLQLNNRTVKVNCTLTRASSECNSHELAAWNKHTFIITCKVLELKIDELTEKWCPFWTRYSIWGKEGRHGGVENRDGWPSFVKSRQKDAETPYLNLVCSVGSGLDIYKGSDKAKWPGKNEGYSLCYRGKGAPLSKFGYIFQALLVFYLSLAYFSLLRQLTPLCGHCTTLPEIQKFKKSFTRKYLAFWGKMEMLRREALQNCLISRLVLKNLQGKFMF